MILLSNQDTFWMLDIMLYSIYKNVDTDFIDTIFIADIGLSEKSKRALSRYKHVQLIHTGHVINGGRADVHTSEWNDAVWQKTTAIQWVLERTDLPLIYSDVDVIVCHDFAQFIDPEYDFQVTVRGVPAHFKKYNGKLISSFFIFNNHDASIRMIEQVRARMKELQDSGQRPPYETQGLNEINLSQWKTGAVWDDNISCENNYIDDYTAIIHYKTNPLCKNNTLARLFLIYLRRIDVVRANIPRKYWRLLRQCVVNPNWVWYIKI